MVQGSAMVSGWDRAVLADCVSCCFHCPIFVANSSFDKSLEENLSDKSMEEFQEFLSLLGDLCMFF